MHNNWDNTSFAQGLLSGSTAGDYGGVAWHCYDTTADPTVMTWLHNQYPNVDQYETECSSDTQPTDIIAYSTTQMALLSAQNWAKGAILWNVALNSSDGPHLGGCTDCVPIVTIDTTTNSSGQVTSASYTLDNNYYQLGQLSEFVPTGAVRIASTVNAHGIVTAAFKDPSGQEVLVATNTNSTSTAFEVTWNDQGSFSYTLPSRATATFVGSVPAAQSLSGTTATGVLYNIVSRTSGKPFGIANASTSNGGQAIEWTNDGDPDQEWMLEDAGNGYYNIVDANSLMALDDTNGSTSNGTQMQQWSLTPGDSNQQWQISSLGNGYYTITNKTSGLNLDLTNGALADGTAIQQWHGSSGDFNQKWQFVPVANQAPTAGEVFKLVSAVSGSTIDVSGQSTANGAQIVEESNSGGLSQEWTVQSAGNGYYNLINNNSGLVSRTRGSGDNGHQASFAPAAAADTRSQ